jgi:hypothetical protein
VVAVRPGNGDLVVYYRCMSYMGPRGFGGLEDEVGRVGWFTEALMCVSMRRTLFAA